jgi:hypothetical protein
VCIGSKHKDHCGIALKYATKAFAGKAPEEIENLMRIATSIASGTHTTHFKNGGGVKPDQAEVGDENATEVASLATATSDKFLRYISVPMRLDALYNSELTISKYVDFWVQIYWLYIMQLHQQTFTQRSNRPCSGSVVEIAYKLP